MLRWVLFVALFCVGCVHPELIGYPPTGGADPSPAQPSNTDSTDEPGDASILRARFTTRASLAEINRTACALQPSIVVDGRQRKIVMHIGGVTPCEPPAEGAIRANISTLSADGGGQIVVVDLVAPDAAANEVADLRAGLRDTARELARRIASVHRASEALEQTDAPPKDDPKKKKHYPSARVLLVSGILWACTAATAGAAILIMAGGAASSSSSAGEGFGALVAGAFILTFGAAPLALASIVTLIVAGGLYAGEDHGP